MNRTFRITWRAAPSPWRTLSADALITEIERLRDRGLSTAPAGPILVEALDAQHRVSWRAFYTSAMQLPSLLLELEQGRSSDVECVVSDPDQRVHKESA